ncbi:MAG TPA: hypothetical protein VGO36_09125 [Solirubrobacterales bacterium]|nr:hypothetical protein [Solirubrobacterales bacterium]
MSKLKERGPSPAMVVAVIALFVALAGTAYAAQSINGGAIKKQTIGGGKLKQKTLTGYQINVNKLGVVPSAKTAVRASHTYWAVVNNPASPGNATLARASDPTISAAEGGGAVNVVFPGDISGCANVAGRDNAGTTVPNAGYAQTNTSPANPNAVEVHTRDKAGANEDADFHLIVVCP